MPEWILHSLLVLAILAPFISLLFFFKKYYKVIGADEVGIVTGAFRHQRISGTGNVRNYSVLRSGGTIVWPVINQIHLLNLAPREIEIKIDVWTNEFLPLEIDAVLAYTIDTTDDATLMKAAEKFAKVQDKELYEKIEPLVQGGSREIIAEMELDQVHWDRKELEKKVEETIQGPFEQLGLIVISFTIRNILPKPASTDSKNPFDLEGAKVLARKERESNVAREQEAQRERDEKKKAKRDTDMHVAEYETDARTKEMEEEAKRETEKARVEQERNRRVREEEKNTKVAHTNFQREEEIRATEAIKDQKIVARNATKEREVVEQQAKEAEEIAKREAQQAISIKGRQAEREEGIAEQVTKRDVQVETQAAKKDVEIAEQATRKSIALAEQETEKAAGLARQETEKRVADDKRELVEILQALQGLEFALKEKELRVQTIADAQVVREKKEIEADADRRAKIVESEGIVTVSDNTLKAKENEARGEFALAKAKADGIKARLMAEVDARREMSAVLADKEVLDKFLIFFKEALEKAPELVEAFMGTEGLAGVVGKVAEPISAIDSIRIVDTGGKGGAQSQIAGLADITPQVLFNFATRMKAAGFGALLNKVGITNDVLSALEEPPRQDEPRPNDKL